MTSGPGHIGVARVLGLLRRGLQRAEPAFEPIQSRHEFLKRGVQRDQLLVQFIGAPIGKADGFFQLLKPIGMGRGVGHGGGLIGGSCPGPAAGP